MGGLLSAVVLPAEPPVSLRHVSWTALFAKQDFPPSPHVLPLLSIVSSNLLMEGSPFSISPLTAPSFFSPFNLTLALAIAEFKLNNSR